MNNVNRHPTKTIRSLLLLAGLVVSSIANAQFWTNKQPSLLPEEEAFVVTANISNEGVLQVDWSIADGYYMYRDQFAVESLSEAITLGPLILPEGVIEDDPEFGEVTVYFYNAELKAQIKGAGNLDLLLKGQGCNKPVGVCYPPMVRN